MYSIFFIFHVVLERSCYCSHGLKIRSCIEYQMKEYKNLKILSFLENSPPTLIPFIVLNKNQHALGKEMAIMKHGMQNKEIGNEKRS